MAINAGSPVGSQRRKERIPFCIHGPRRIEHTERSIRAVKGVGRAGRVDAAAEAQSR